MEERELVKRVLEGDERAQRRFYEDQVDRVYRLAFRMTGDDQVARECTQDVFVRAFDKLSGFRGEASLSTWMHSVTTSVVLSYLRRIKRIRKREVDLEAAAVEGGHEERDRLLDDAIAKAIEGLTAAYRAVVIMHDIEGYTHEEIGTALGIAVGTSKVRLSRARAQLRTALADVAEEYAL